MVPKPVVLRDQTIALSDRQSMPFLALVTGQDGKYAVVVVHRLVRYMDAPGDDSTGLHDRILGLTGDILPHQYPVVEVPSTSFHLVGTAVCVPTIGAMAALLNTWDTEADPVLGPHVEADPETEVVRPRHTQLVPGRYASLLIHRRQVRPNQAYQELVSAMMANDKVENCQDNVTWLRAACTARGGGGAQTGVSSVLHIFPPLLLPPEVYNYLTSKVKSDLLALANGEREGGAATAELTGALRALAARRGGGGGDDDEPSRAAPKNIAEAYRETFPTLLRFCDVASTESVAPLWTRLENCKKGEQHVVLTQELHKVCMSRGLSTEIYAPIVTTTLKQMVLSFNFLATARMT